MIGTAGHIDHGKTSLVAKLTNVDTDRLPEEKTRGISIDLGFANWESGGFRFGVVDVPGHEKFVRNMVAGATGINIALLVVAADDSVMPQTREHLEIMQLLGVARGVIAITKTDLVDEEMQELVAEEVQETVAGTFLESAPIIAVSSETGEGIDQLREAIVATATTMPHSRDRDYFRMPVDRSFSIDGHGTVITGSVLHGDVHGGDVLELLPQQTEARVRNVQSHYQNADDAGARQRTAINLAGIKPEDVPRGTEVATPGRLVPTQRILVELNCLSSSPIEFKDRLELQLHIGTGDQLARLVLKGDPILPGQSACCEIRLEGPIVADHDQRFIVRRVSPARTVGGGRILDPEIRPGSRIRDRESYFSALAAETAEERLDYLLQLEPTIPPSGERLAARSGLTLEQYNRLIESLKQSGQIRKLGRKEQPIFLHEARVQSLCKSTMNIIRSEIEKQQPRRSLPMQFLKSACQALAPATVIDAVFDELVRSKELTRVGQNYGPADGQVQLTKRERGWLEASLTSIIEGGKTPPTAKELAKTLDVKPDVIQTLTNVLVEDALVIAVDAMLCYSPEALDGFRKELIELLSENEGPTMSEIREAWGVSRKYAIPLCEYFDQQKLTIRNGDQRRAGPNLRLPFFDAVDEGERAE